MMKRAEQLTLNGARASVFWGFDFRYLRSLRGAMRPHYTPKLKKRTALMRELKEAFLRQWYQTPHPGIYAAVQGNDTLD